VEPRTPGLLELLSLGATSGVLVAAGVGFGWLADSQLGTTPVLTAVGLILGVVAAVAGTWGLARRMLRPRQ